MRFPHKGIRPPPHPPSRDPACGAQTAELSVHGGLTAALLVFAWMVRLVLGVFSEYIQVQGSVSSGRKHLFLLLFLGPQGEASAYVSRI